jgi:hypothetical protein
VVPGEMMNQVADFENGKGSDKWQVTSDEEDHRFRTVSIENPKSKIQNEPMGR